MLRQVCLLYGLVVSLVTWPAASAADTDDGLTPLHRAAIAGKVNDVKRLLDEGADIESRTRLQFIAGLQAGSYTPLHLAVGANQPDVIGLLLKRGASVENKRFGLPQMLRHASYNRQQEVIDALIAGCDKKYLPETLKTAVDGRDIAVLIALQKRGEDVAKALPSPAIHWAITYGNQELAVLFLETGADPIAVDNSNTPLSRAASRGYDDLVRRLLSKKVSVDRGTTTGSTPLQFAVENGHLGCVRLLLENGADSRRIDDARRKFIKASTDKTLNAISELLEGHERQKATN